MAHAPGRTKAPANPASSDHQPTPAPGGWAPAGAAHAQQAEPPRGDALALLLSPEGDFVRGIVTEELAKGIDAAWRVAADAAVGQAQQQVLDVVRAEGEASQGRVL